MSLILDCSATLAWHFRDERTPAVEELLERVVREGAIVPVLWRYEVANGLQTAIRRGRIDAAYRDRALSNLSELNIRVDFSSETRIWSDGVRLSSEYNLTIYDAAYLELALRHGVALATLDLPLARAAEACGVRVLLAN